VRVGWPAPEKKVGGGIYREARSDGRPIAAAARAGWGAEATREWVRAREAGGRRLRPEVAAGAFDGAARAADGNRGRRGWRLKTIHVQGGPAQPRWDFLRMLSLPTNANQTRVQIYTVMNVCAVSARVCDDSPDIDVVRAMQRKHVSLPSRPAW
jgi:hypothetical protein